MIGLEGLSKYIDWGSIVDDYNLETGDIPPEDLFTLEDILERYIKTNQYKPYRKRLHIHTLCTKNVCKNYSELRQ